MVKKPNDTTGRLLTSDGLRVGCLLLLRRNRPGNLSVEVTESFGYHMDGFLSYLFMLQLLNKSIKGHHRQQVLLVGRPVLVAILADLLVDEAAGLAETFFFSGFYPHGVFSFGYFDFYGKFSHEKVITNTLLAQLSDAFINFFDVLVNGTL